MRRRSTAAVWFLGAIVFIAIAVVGARFGGPWLWGVLADYIEPKTPTERKDLVNIVVLIAAGLVGLLTALAALLNAYFSRRNLQNAREALHQQRELDEERAQDDALQAYFQQMGKLLAEQKLMETVRANDPLRLLARAQTLTVLDRLDARRKRNLVLFLRGTGLAHKKYTFGILAEGNLRESDLRNASLRGADLSGAKLSEADLREANLIAVDLSNASLRAADLREANLRDATLHRVRGLTNEMLEQQAKTLEGATMPDGLKHP